MTDDDFPPTTDPPIIELQPGDIFMPGLWTWYSRSGSVTIFYYRPLDLAYFCDLLDTGE